MRRYITLMMTLLFLAIPISTYAANWQMDPAHSSFQFKVQHLTVSNVKGDFGKFQGAALIEDQDITHLKVEVTIDAASINTGHAQRDEHLRGPDFFDVTKYPTILFVSKKAIKTDANKLKVIGDLTLRGVSREITVDVEGPTPEVKDPWGNFRRGVTATAKINRREFGLTWSKALDTGGMVVGDEVAIYIEIELIKK